MKRAAALWRTSVCGDINLVVFTCRWHPLTQTPDPRPLSNCPIIHSNTSWGTFTPTTACILGHFMRTNYSPTDQQLWMFEKPAETVILSGFSLDYHHKDSLNLKLKIQQHANHQGRLETKLCVSLQQTLILKFEDTPTLRWHTTVPQQQQCD